MAAAIRFRQGASSMGRARNFSQMAGDEGSPEFRDYRVWAQGLSEKLTQAVIIVSQSDLVRESTDSLILERRKKIGAHNVNHVWIVAGLAISGYLFGIGAGTLYTEYERRTLGAVEEPLELTKKLGREEY
uniref:Uncharacterized protein n=1 Tax=Oryza punctata TaxID=4537 RepID=A0A0E0LG83_ORYPU